MQGMIMLLSEKRMGADPSPGYYGFGMDTEHQSGIDRDIQEANVDPYQLLFEEMILNESRKTTRHHREMAEIEELLRSTGWTSIQGENIDLPLNLGNELGFIDGSNYTPDYWAKILASKRDELQQLRVQSMANVSTNFSSASPIPAHKCCKACGSGISYPK
jgi:hypothetical protein